MKVLRTLYFYGICLHSTCYSKLISDARMAQKLTFQVWSENVNVNVISLGLGSSRINQPNGNQIRNSATATKLRLNCDGWELLSNFECRSVGVCLVSLNGILPAKPMRMELLAPCRHWLLISAMDTMAVISILPSPLPRLVLAGYDMGVSSSVRGVWNPMSALITDRTPPC